MPDIFAFDDAVRAQGYSLVAGIDEAGRGPLAGPVVAAAVILRPQERIDGLRDSKQLTSRNIETLFGEILCRAVAIGTGIVDAETIDRLNILNATKKAMADAVGDLLFVPHLLLIDALALDACSIDQRAIVKGESVSASIAAASVVAKFVRDAIMNQYHVRYPAYGFHRNKGYGTREHVRRIRECGPCPIHRMSFSPVATLPLFHGDE